jgi:hypothetical protein
VNPQTAFKQALTTWLKQQPALVALLWDTTLADCRIFPFRQSQNAAFPELTWWIRSGRRYKAMDGPVGVSLARVRFDCRGLTFEDAEAVADAVRGLDGFLGYAAGMWFQAFLVDPEGNGEDSGDPPVHGEEAGTAMVSVDASITYAEPM